MESLQGQGGSPEATSGPGPAPGARAPSQVPNFTSLGLQALDHVQGCVGLLASLAPSPALSLPDLLALQRLRERLSLLQGNLLDILRLSTPAAPQSLPQATLAGLPLTQTGLPHRGLAQGSLHQAGPGALSPGLVGTYQGLGMGVGGGQGLGLGYVPEDLLFGAGPLRSLGLASGSRVSVDLSSREERLGGRASAPAREEAGGGAFTPPSGKGAGGDLLPGSVGTPRAGERTGQSSRTLDALFSWLPPGPASLVEGEAATPQPGLEQDSRRSSAAKSPSSRPLQGGIGDPRAGGSAARGVQDLRPQAISRRGSPNRSRGEGRGGGGLAGVEALVEEALQGGGAPRMPPTLVSAGVRSVREVVSHGGAIAPSHDGFLWHRYGKKAIKDAAFPRVYYRCAEESCQAKKFMQVLKKEAGPKRGNSQKGARWVSAVSYENEHNHAPPFPAEAHAQGQKGGAAEATGGSPRLTKADHSPAEELGRESEHSSPAPARPGSQAALDREEGGQGGAHIPAVTLELVGSDWANASGHFGQRSVDEPTQRSSGLPLGPSAEKRPRTQPGGPGSRGAGDATGSEWGDDSVRKSERQVAFLAESPAGVLGQSSDLLVPSTGSWDATSEQAAKRKRLEAGSLLGSPSLIARARELMLKGEERPGEEGSGAVGNENLTEPGQGLSRLLYESIGPSADAEASREGGSENQRQQGLPIESTSLEVEIRGRGHQGGSSQAPTLRLFGQFMKRPDESE